MTGRGAHSHVIADHGDVTIFEHLTMTTRTTEQPGNFPDPPPIDSPEIKVSGTRRFLPLD